MPLKTSSGKWKWGNIERKTKGELARTVYGIWKKNGSPGSFSAFWHGRHKVNESTSSNICYHCTEVDPEKIKLEGWKVGKGFTLQNRFTDLYKEFLPSVPVFVSDKNIKVWSSDSKYCIEIDISGLKKYPDFGHLSDYGAYYDDESKAFYWNAASEISNEKLKDYVLKNCEDLTLYADDFPGDLSLELIGTCCVDGTKLKNRIVGFKEKSN